MSTLSRLTHLALATLVMLTLSVAKVQDLDLFQTLQANNTTTTFLKFANDADIVNILQSQGPYTILVPNDKAFATFKAKNPALYKKVVSDRNLLKQLLLYHFMNSVTMASDFKDSNKLDTLEGDRITVANSTKGPKFNRRAFVVTSNLRASNGVIHIIDTVLIPKTIRADTK